jgi:acetyl-CoA carboxylase biotin carboxyl carrier protein
MSSPRKPAPGSPSIPKDHDLNLEELKLLIDLVAKQPIQEFEFESGTLRFRIRKDGNASAPVPSSVIQPAQNPSLQTPLAPPVVEAADSGLHYITSPIVGIFYRASSPNSPPFVQEGDFVKPAQTLCIVEAMKLMNEIESDAAGEIVRVLAENGQPVEYGERLFALRVG